MNVKQALASIALAAALLPASASAGTATLEGGTFSFTGGPRESNYVIADVTANCEALGISPCFSFSDSAAYRLAPPAGCVNQRFTEYWILCPVPNALRIDTGDELDTVLDWNGASAIDAGPGDDSVFGHNGADTIKGGDGADVLLGGRDNDSIDGGNDGAPGERDRIANDVEAVIGGQAGDVMVGSPRSDQLIGYSGDDNVRGGRGDDSLDGGPDEDVVAGERGADTISGGHGQDVVDGGRGRDNIYGEYAVGCDGLQQCIGGADILRAHDGERDLISCGVGTDRAQIDRFDVVRDIPGATECESLVVPRRRR